MLAERSGWCQGRRAVHSTSATRAAAGPGATAALPGPKPTTSSIGRGAAGRPTSTTWSCSATATTGWSTSAAFRSSAPTRTRSSPSHHPRTSSRERGRPPRTPPDGDPGRLPADGTRVACQLTPSRSPDRWRDPRSAKFPPCCQANRCSVPCARDRRQGGHRQCTARAHRPARRHWRVRPPPATARAGPDRARRGPRLPSPRHGGRDHLRSPPHRRPAPLPRRRRPVAAPRRSPTCSPSSATPAPTTVRRG